MNQLLSIAADCLPQFDELYVVSDLHLGGTAGFQIFNSGRELAGLIDRLRELPSERRVAFLVNGDFVDFLAERPASHFDPAGAVAKLDRIVGDPAFADVWRALRAFAATPSRTLVVNLGNHDLELALPWVRAHLLDVLSAGDVAARGRIVLSFEGSGVLCRVGDAKVLCVHGNEVDDWNVADYETIRRLGRDVVQGRLVETWIPNAGSRLVIEVMNDIKSKFPFVDLLKPEMQAVIPTLLALAPNQRSKLAAIGATAGRLMIDKLKRATGFLGAEEEELASAMEDFMLTRSGVLDIMPNATLAAGARRSAEQMLDDVEEHIGDDPMLLVGRDKNGEYLGTPSAVMKAALGEEPSEVLREALESLGKDRSFDIDDEDATFRLLDKHIGDGPDFLISGHTHLERALRRRNGHGAYYNSGTWARLIRLDSDVLQDKDRFKQVFNAFKAGTLKALDSLEKLVTRKLTVVAVRSDASSTYGELLHVEPLAADAPPGTGVELTPVEKSRLEG